MKIYISTKQIKKRGNQVTAMPYELHTLPRTLRHLITVLATDGMDSYNRRLQANNENPVLPAEDIEDMSLVGKIGFGIPFGSRMANLGDALETAFSGFEDGLYRVFVGEREMESLDDPLDLQEEDTVTIIRLVMLTGGYF